MIDTAALLVSSLLVLYTVIRAVKLDRILPWFGIEKPDTRPGSRSSKQRR